MLLKSIYICPLRFHARIGEFSLVMSLFVGACMKTVGAPLQHEAEQQPNPSKRAEASLDTKRRVQPAALQIQTRTNLENLLSSRLCEEKVKAE